MQLLGNSLGMHLALRWICFLSWLCFIVSNFYVYNFFFFLNSLHCNIKTPKFRLWPKPIEKSLDSTVWTVVTTLCRGLSNINKKIIGRVWICLEKSPSCLGPGAGWYKKRADELHYCPRGESKGGGLVCIKTERSSVLHWQFTDSVLNENGPDLPQGSHAVFGQSSRSSGPITRFDCTLAEMYVWQV